MVLSGALTGLISCSALSEDGQFEAKKPVVPVTAPASTAPAATVKPTTRGQYNIGGFVCGVDGSKVSCDNASLGLSFAGVLSGNKIQIDYGDIITLFDGLGCCDSLDVNLVGSDVLVDASALVAEMRN